MILLKSFEAENVQCVDVVHGTLLKGGVELFQPFTFSCSHRRANTGLNHVVRVSNHMPGTPHTARHLASPGTGDTSKDGSSELSSQVPCTEGNFPPVCPRPHPHWSFQFLDSFLQYTVSYLFKVFFCRRLMLPLALYPL